MNKDYIQTWNNLKIEDLEVSKILFENEKFSNSFFHFQKKKKKDLLLLNNFAGFVLPYNI